jgi:kynureninase
MSLDESSVQISHLLTLDHPDLLLYRKEFPLVQQKTYLNNCSIGALSIRSLQGMSQFMMWNEWELWLDQLTKARQKFAAIIGAQVHEVALASSVSAALGSLSTALDYRIRNKVVMSTLDFPTLPYQWLAKERLGVECHFVDSPDQVSVPPELFASIVDNQTALLATSHVCYTSGYIQDVRALADIAHEHGAYLLIDDYQGTGQVPINVKSLDIDFLVTGALKWLMGGPGLAFVYIREGLIRDLEPTITGWFGHSEQFQFQTRSFAFRPDATKIEMGTPAMAAVYAANGGLDIVLEAGIDKISERSHYLANDLIRRAHDRGWTVLSPPELEQRSAIVMLEMDNAQAIVQELRTQNIIIDTYFGLLRVSPYFYNTIEENALLVDALAEIQDRKKKHS